MEKHKCRLCSRRFGSGRALGGHMRSHFTILPVPTKTHSNKQLSETGTSSTSSSELRIRKRKRSTTEFNQLESSMSEETSSEEDHLAMCLMFLSRDKWVRKEEQEQQPVGKIHECPVCYKAFKSGQALGGHKRSHLLLTSTAAVVHSSTVAVSAATDVWLIDLNLPAPLEEAEVPVLC